MESTAPQFLGLRDSFILEPIERVDEDTINVLGLQNLVKMANFELCHAKILTIQCGIHLVFEPEEEDVATRQKKYGVFYPCAPYDTEDVSEFEKTSGVHFLSDRPSSFIYGSPTL
ncbi:unnamed protein product, partial [Ilex paraguariensis]